jgi:hypothetical protein
MWQMLLWHMADFFFATQKTGNFLSRQDGDKLRRRHGPNMDPVSNLIQVTNVDLYGFRNRIQTRSGSGYKPDLELNPDFEPDLELKQNSEQELNSFTKLSVELSKRMKSCTGGTVPVPTI